MKNRYNRGFTLVELLIVMVIIGILLAIVMVALSQARSKGADGAVKSNLVNLRSQAELYYSTAGNYGTYSGGSAVTCPTTLQGAASGIMNDVVVMKALNTAVSAGGSGSLCVINGSSYAIAVGLKSSTTISWCIDSNKASKIATSAPATAILNGVCG